jgi:putative MATE family efflux protein
MAAVGSNGPVINIFLSTFIGLSLGSNVVIAKLTGRGNREGVSRGVHTAVVIGFLGGVLVAMAAVPLSGPILRLMDVPPEILGMATLYLRIFFAGMPFILLYNFESAVFRSQGDTRTPLICLSISGVLNVALNLFFVLVCGLDVEGVALATVISNVASSMMLLFFLLHHRGLIRLNMRALKIDIPIFKETARIGIPSGMQSMTFSLSNLIIQSALNGLGADYMAGSSAALNIEIMMFFLLNSFGQACVTFIGQNYGAGNHARCRRVVRDSMIMDLIFTGVASVLVITFGTALLHVFNGDPEVIRLGMVRIRYIISGECIYVLIEVLSGAMRGLRYSLIPAAISVGGICVFRIVWVFTAFAAHPTFVSLLLTYPVSWVITAAALVIAYFAVTRKVLRPDDA